MAFSRSDWVCSGRNIPFLNNHEWFDGNIGFIQVNETIPSQSVTFSFAIPRNSSTNSASIGDRDATNGTTNYNWSEYNNDGCHSGYAGFPSGFNYTVFVFTDAKNCNACDHVFTPIASRSFSNPNFVIAGNTAPTSLNNQ